MLKPYQSLPIQDCGEPLVAIPLTEFSTETPPPYARLGADYGDQSPYCLRAGVLAALQDAQANLRRIEPGWSLHIFDAYRPLAVQQFMVDYTYGELLKGRSLSPDALSNAQQADLWQEVYQFWAAPNPDPATPPPHSTGAALDLTLINALGELVPMGGEIDEISVRSHPDYYAHPQNDREQTYGDHRQLLRDAMAAAGFRQHPNEWWHFSQGDQLWAWLNQQSDPTGEYLARYGRVIF
ncbi:M15 family metallopeptidase [Spirulina sp. CCNP1310]|uniref:M15 family metallopeptidase n=1 Tax=Spirulina sp. CCNP1310 TaxID=3110249 RepID=UPI002B1F0D35|nr:M15 family metallopeptidase [Spirulina sp. CCNP1310]MEA5419572.1 M15 family metallopeptidase [Spirulina sp. CCNP1310]